ncbi:MAG: UDP-N-acetylglucosamine 2-epimerase (non-hydrolyzing) [Phototrophicaceae bacterium]
MVKILTIVGARPQFIKAAPVSRAIRDLGMQEYLVHTGQHYDENMSQIFFTEMGIPEPDVNLEIGSGSHGAQTGAMLIALEEAMLREEPDCVLVYGDTNSTLAGALAAAKLHIPIAHVEAGLRSFNRDMPEEHNRVLTDHSASLLFCPTDTAVEHLASENIIKGVHQVGDTMFDAVLAFRSIAEEKSTILDTFNLEPKSYHLATIHRPYNTDFPENLRGLLNTFEALEHPVIFPIHPRTRQKIAQVDPTPLLKNIRLVEPVGYLDMLMLEANAQFILTDSGGIQKEAYFLEVPCLTLRPETEWVETLEDGWNVLVGRDYEKTLATIQQKRNLPAPRHVFGDGHAAEKIAIILKDYLS